MREFGQLAVVQDPAKGGLLSGGILDMIAVKHTPVRPIPREHLTPEALAGATMAVNVDADSLTPEQKEILRNFTRHGGTLLTGPPGWKDQRPQGDKITLDPAELERLNDIWRDVNSMVGRRNLGVRLFNVSSMLSNVLVSADGKTEVVHIVNYSDYPVENVTLHYLGDYKHATLLTPDGIEKRLEVFQAEEGGAWTSTKCRSAPPSDWSCEMTRREWLAMISAAPPGTRGGKFRCSRCAGIHRQVRLPTTKTLRRSWAPCSTSWAASKNWSATRPSPSNST